MGRPALTEIHGCISFVLSNTTSRCSLFNFGSQRWKCSSVERTAGKVGAYLVKLRHDSTKNNRKTTERVLVFVVFLSSLLNRARSFTKYAPTCPTACSTEKHFAIAATGPEKLEKVTKTQTTAVLTS